MILSNNNTCFQFARFMQSIKVHQVSKYCQLLALQKPHECCFCFTGNCLPNMQSTICTLYFLVGNCTFTSHWADKKAQIKGRKTATTKMTQNDLISTILRVRPRFHQRRIWRHPQRYTCIKLLGMTDPPLAIFNCDVPVNSIHGIKEWHLLMIIDLPPPSRKELLYGIEQRWIRWKEETDQGFMFSPSWSCSETRCWRRSLKKPRMRSVL